jgi:conjugal transfer/type IV secretion protein DotA/TraY
MARNEGIPMKKLLTFLILCFVACAAHADSSTGTSLNQFTPPAGDASVVFLQEMFGSIVGLISSGGNVRGGATDSVIGAMMKIFNSAVMFLGMLFVAYTTIKGTVDSAHDGELLGRKMSSIWIPLRTAGGTALLLPLGSGFSLIQICILWLALQGVGVADAIWNAAINQFSQESMLANPVLPDARPLAGSILKFEVCASAMNKQFSDSGRSTRITPVTNQQSVSNGTASNANLSSYSPDSTAADSFGSTQGFANASYAVTGYTWNANDNSYLDPNVCGGLSWKQSWQGGSSSSSTQALKAPLLAAHAQAVQAMIQTLQPLADQIVAGQKPAAGALETAATAYETTLRTAAQTAVSQENNLALTDFLSAAKSGGWIYAGTWYNNITKMNDVMQATLNGLPESVPIDISNKETQDVLQNYSDAMTTADAYIQASPANKIKIAYDAETSTENSSGWDYVRRMISAPFMGAINKMTQNIAGSNLNHISQMKSFGDTIVSTGETLLAGTVTAVGVASSNLATITTSTVFSTSAVLQFLSVMITMIVMGLFLLGVTLSTYIPMIPFITWVTSVANWFVLVLESIIAGPIFAVAHIHPDGDDVVGRAGNGYMFILSLVMRPALMLFGLIGAMLLTEPLTGIINVAFMSVVAGIQADSITGIVSFFAYVSIYVAVMTTVVHVAFSLIHWIPDNILRWISARTEGLADAQRQGEASHQVFAGATHQVQSAGQSGLAGMGKEEKGKGPDNRDLLGGE